MPERGWRPPPPSGGEGELRLKKLAAAVAAIAALAERLYDPADPFAVRLGLDRERHEATAHAIFRDMHAPPGALIEAQVDTSDDAAAPGDRVTAILQEAARTGDSDLDLVFVEADLRRLALEQAGSLWAIRPGFGTPRSEEEFLHAIRRDVDLVALLSSVMASAAEAVWMRADAASPRPHRVASARARGHEIMPALPPGLWGAIEPLLDGLYREWRARALRDVAAGRPPRHSAPCAAERAACPLASA